MRRASIDRWKLVPAMKESGHSYSSPKMPRRRLMIWRTGMGLTAPSRFFVRKSQKILGQKKASSAAAIWSGECQLRCSRENSEASS